jgi:hypothetical protein
VSFAQTIAPPPDLRRKVSDLLGVLGWQGVFELELIESEDKGFIAIDFNRVCSAPRADHLAGAPLTAAWCDWVLGMGRIEGEARPATTTDGRTRSFGTCGDSCESVRFDPRSASCGRDGG